MKTAQEIKIPKGDYQNFKVAIVAANYYKDLTSNLITKSKQVFEKAMMPQQNVEVFLVPGSWELPVMIATLLSQNRFNAIVAFGIIIKGDTYHFEAIANETARALMELAITHKTPIINEIIPAYSLEEAQKRAGPDKYNKGIEAALATLTIFNALNNAKENT